MRAGAATRRLHLLLALSVGLGAATGAAVAGFDWLVRDQLFAGVQRAPLAVAALAPIVGLAVAALAIRHLGGGDSATTDAYIRAYHQRAGRLSVRRLPPKILACAATLGSGAALGYEGPAILMGGSIGSFTERRFMNRVRHDDAKVLMVAGAAAGVAAVFKAPLTGVVFALEVPYLQDLARRALLPALVAAGSSYLVFVTILGTEPVLAFGGTAPFDVRDLLGGVLVGVLCGIFARAGAHAMVAAKRVSSPLWMRVPAAGALLCGLAFASHHWFGEPLTLGAGYDAIAWARGHEDALGLLVALFVLRFAATWITVAGGGVGGLFIPLVTQGALLGLVVQSLVTADNPGLFPIVGIAAFLGPGYRTPLAGVAFVAEATGQPGFVVPALLAAAASQLAMGRWSFSPYQRTQRQPELVPTSRLRVREIMSPGPDLTRAAPRIADATATMPVASADDDVARTAERMRETDVDAMAVVDDGTVVGIVTIHDIAAVERLLDHLADDAT